MAIHDQPSAEIRRILVIALIGLLAACSKKADVSENAPASAPQKATASNITSAVIAAATGGATRQFKCVIDEVNMRLDPGNFGDTRVVPLPAIGAKPIASNVLLLEATSPADASERIMQAKQEYKRVPPVCEEYKLGIKDAKLDTATAVEKYAPLSSAEQPIYLYYGISKLSPDYADIAQHLYPAYRNERDSFKKQDILKTLQPEIDDRIKQADSQRLLWMDADANMLHYDQTTKSFLIRMQGLSLKPGAYVAFGNGTYDYRVMFDTNGKNELRYVPANEEEARNIEAIVTSRATPGVNPQNGTRMTVRVYIQALKAASENNYKAIMTRVVQVDVLDKDCAKCVNDKRPESVLAKIDFR